jgi:isopenicillin-N N-acyltransferase like protein
MVTRISWIQNLRMALKFNLFLISLLIGAVLSWSNGFSQGNQPLKLNDKRIRVIELKGDDYHKGFQHGKQLKTEIAEVFEKWKTNIALSTKRNADSVITEFLDSTNFRLAIRKWTPGIMDELKGISIGSGQKFSDVFAFQLVDEFWVYLDKKTHLHADHCSGIGLSSTANHPAFIAQNMDLENYMNGYQVLLHMKASKTEPEQYILTCAGLTALTGMNANGVGVCVNTLLELQASNDGLPVAFIIRGILSKQNSEDALSFLKTVKHASGQNYIIGIKDSVYDFEASSGNVVRFIPIADRPGVVYHTNHAIVNHDVKPWKAEYHRKVLAGETKNMNSEIRYAVLERKLGIRDNEINADLIKTILRSKDDDKNPICRSLTEGGGIFTFSSVLFSLSGRKSIQVTCGSPDKSEFYQYFFK